jgi:hypothetical protein
MTHLGLSLGLTRLGLAGGLDLTEYAVNGETPALVADFENDAYGGTISGFSDFTESGTSFDTTVGARRLHVDATSGDTLSLAAAKLPSITGPLSFLITGNITYANDGTANQARFYWLDGSEYIRTYLATNGPATGRFLAWQSDGTLDTATVIGADLTPGTDVPFKMASRHTGSAIQSACNGTASAENTTPTGFPSLTGLNLDLATVGNMRLQKFIIWTTDIGTTGLTEGTS